ncbi:hypothetical protein V2J09_023834 [Rumex salicifolius]
MHLVYCMGEEIKQTRGSSNGNTARKLVKEFGDVGLDDYGPVDPSPSSKKLRPGPIQHGTPLIPYIPRPSPPPPS